MAQRHLVAANGVRVGRPAVFDQGEAVVDVAVLAETQDQVAIGVQNGDGETVEFAGERAGERGLDRKRCRYDR